MHLDVALNKRDNERIGAGVAQFDQILKKGLVEEEAFVDAFPNWDLLVFVFGLTLD